MSEGSLAFEGYVSHPSLGEEAVPGRIVFAFFRLRFESEAVTLEMPLSRLLIEKGGKGDERIFFSDPEQPDWSVFASTVAILTHALPCVSSRTRSIRFATCTAGANWDGG